jgi:hypothetical protein
MCVASETSSPASAGASAAEHHFAVALARLDQRTRHFIEHVLRLEGLVADARGAAELGDVGVDELVTDAAREDRLIREAAELVIFVACRAEYEVARAEVIVGLLECLPAPCRRAVGLRGRIQRRAAELVLPFFDFRRERQLGVGTLGVGVAAGDDQSGLAFAGLVCCVGRQGPRAQGRSVLVSATAPITVKTAIGST